MTTYELLKAGNTASGKLIEAFRSQDKNASAWDYTVAIVENGLVMQSFPCARTTWKKVFTKVEQRY